MSSETTVLITGASRGIGKGLVAEYLSLPGNTVVAAVRKAASAAPLDALPKASGSRLVVIEIDVADVDTIKRGVGSLESEHNIDHLDLVLANAGNANLSSKLAECEIADLHPFIVSNAYGQLELYKASAPLLRKSSKQTRPKFMYMSSSVGSLAVMNTMLDVSAYGASKALGNFLFRWLSFEQQDIVIWMQHPGTVATDIVKAYIEPFREMGIDLEKTAISVEQACLNIRKIAEEATLENTHGKFFGPDGAELPW